MMKISALFTPLCVNCIRVLYSLFYYVYVVYIKIMQYSRNVPQPGIPDVMVSEAEQRCAWSRNLDPSFCPCRDLKLGHWLSSGRERYH